MSYIPRGMWSTARLVLCLYNARFQHHRHSMEVVDEAYHDKILRGIGGREREREGGREGEVIEI